MTIFHQLETFQTFTQRSQKKKKNSTRMILFTLFLDINGPILEDYEKKSGIVPVMKEGPSQSNDILPLHDNTHCCNFCHHLKIEISDLTTFPILCPLWLPWHFEITKIWKWCRGQRSGAFLVEGTFKKVFSDGINNLGT